MSIELWKVESVESKPIINSNCVITSARQSYSHKSCQNATRVIFDRALFNVLLSAFGKFNVAINIECAFAMILRK